MHSLIINILVFSVFKRFSAFISKPVDGRKPLISSSLWHAKLMIVIGRVFSASLFLPIESLKESFFFKKKKKFTVVIANKLYRFLRFCESFNAIRVRPNTRYCSAGHNMAYWIINAYKLPWLYRTKLLLWATQNNSIKSRSCHAIRYVQHSKYTRTQTQL